MRSPIWPHRPRFSNFEFEFEFLPRISGRPPGRPLDFWSAGTLVPCGLPHIPDNYETLNRFSVFLVLQPLFQPQLVPEAASVRRG